MVYRRRPGGPTIINTALCVITNVVDYDMNIQQAIDAPRIHHQWLPDELVFEPYGLSGDTQKALAALGHKLARPHYLGDAEGIMIEEKTGCDSAQLTREKRWPGGGILIKQRSRVVSRLRRVASCFAPFWLSRQKPQSAPRQTQMAPKGEYLTAFELS